MLVIEGDGVRGGIDGAQRRRQNTIKTKAHHTLFPQNEDKKIQSET